MEEIVGVDKMEEETAPRCPPPHSTRGNGCLGLGLPTSRDPSAYFSILSDERSQSSDVSSTSHFAKLFIATLTQLYNLSSMEIRFFRAPSCYWLLLLSSCPWRRLCCGFPALSLSLSVSIREL